MSGARPLVSYGIALSAALAATTAANLLKPLADAGFGILVSPEKDSKAEQVIGVESGVESGGTASSSQTSLKSSCSIVGKGLMDQGSSSRFGSGAAFNLLHFCPGP